MKRSKQLIILASVLAVVCIGILVLTAMEKKQEQIKATEAVILQIPTDTVESISWDYSEDPFSFRKADGSWIYEDDEAFPVSEENLNEILGVFEVFSASFVIEDVEDYGQYGLDDPECTVQIATASDSYTVKLGDFSRMDEQRYVDIGDGKVYLVNEDPMNTLYTSLSEAIQHDDIPDFERIVDVRIEGAESATILRLEDSNYSYSEEDLYFLQQNGEYLPLDTAAMTQYVNTIAALDLLDYVTYKADDALLESYGLADPELSVTVNFNNDDAADSCTVHISRDPAQLKAAQEAEAAGEGSENVTNYVRIGDSSIVYILDDVDYAILAAATYDDLRHNEVFWADFGSVQQLDAVLEGTTHTFSSTAGSDEDDARNWFFGEGSIDISGIQSALSALSVDSFTEETADGKEELQLTLSLDNAQFPQTALRFVRYDGSYCLVQIDGESIGLVERTAVMDLVESVQSIVLNS